MVLSSARGILTHLGFSETEALVYCELLKNPAATGYAVAKAIKKSQANVYGALESLVAKGAVTFVSSDTKSYRAVSPNELMPRLAAEFQQRCDAAQTALDALVSSDVEDHLYQLKNQNQVYDRAIGMCGRASQSIAFELFPLPFGRLQEALEQAVGRGVGVAGVTFDARNRIDGATCTLSVKVERSSSWPLGSGWPRDHMALVVDAREVLVALFDRQSHEVIHGLYSNSIYLACLFHSAILDALVLNMEKPKMLQTSVNKKLFGTVPKGFIDLVRRGD